MLGLMQRYPLLISSLIVHAARHRGGAEVVSNLGGASLHRTTYAEVERRSRRLVRVLPKLGIGFGDRVARSPGTITAISSSTTASRAWGRYATPSIRGSPPTTSPIIIDHAKDCVMFADPSFVALLGRDRAQGEFHASAPWCC